ncbi:probable protein phosphatase 2C 6, partial [Tanacetum coccineum]
GDDTTSLAPVVSANEELMKLKQAVASLLEVPEGENINEVADDAGEKLADLYAKLHIVDSLSRKLTMLYKREQLFNAILNIKKETYCSIEERPAISLNLADSAKATKSDTEKESYCTTKVRAAITSSLTDLTTDTILVTDKETYCSTEARAAVRFLSNDNKVKPSKKLKARITSDDQSPSEAGQTKERRKAVVMEMMRQRATEVLKLSVVRVEGQMDIEDELLRIEEQEGKAIYWNGTRVLGVLSMSRAIGDGNLRAWIIPVPKITLTTRTDEDECLIIASDGLWDVMTKNEVSEVARQILRSKRPSAATNDESSAAQTLADSLTEIYMRGHNIFVIIVKPQNGSISVLNTCRNKYTKIGSDMLMAWTPINNESSGLTICVRSTDIVSSFASGAEFGDELHVIDVDNSTKSKIKKFENFQGKRFSPILEALEDRNQLVFISAKLGDQLHVLSVENSTKSNIKKMWHILN